MSTNHSARLHSRRTLLTAALAGTVAGGATFGAKVALASAGDMADEAFTRWVAASAKAHTTGLDDDAMSVLFNALMDEERAVRDLPPSIMKAGAIILIETSCHGSQEHSPEEIEAEDYDDRDVLRVLHCLAPFLIGTVGAYAADIVNNPARPIGEGLFFTAAAPGFAGRLAVRGG